VLAQTYAAVNAASVLRAIPRALFPTGSSDQRTCQYAH